MVYTFCYGKKEVEHQLVSYAVNEGEGHLLKCNAFTNVQNKDDCTI